jgi:hypothetical protein
MANHGPFGVAGALTRKYRQRGSLLGQSRPGPARSKSGHARKAPKADVAESIGISR